MNVDCPSGLKISGVASANNADNLEIRTGSMDITQSYVNCPDTSGWLVVPFMSFLKKEEKSIAAKIGFHKHGKQKEKKGK